MSWYDGNARILPWRESRDPYFIWVSEIMLQQTQVKTVIPYYDRFIGELPDIAALAAADEAKLLKLWEGLGYYSRVRNMQKAARIILSEFGGKIPESPDLLAKLPGIGDYTAGAVASIAFGLPVAAVDGNVLRVFSRIFGSQRDIGDPKVKKEFRAIAIALQPKSRAGDFNQALMELGATVCLPNGAPLCGICPASGFCSALKTGMTAQIPVKAEKAKRKIEERTILVVTDGKSVLMRKREQKGLLAGMAEPMNLTGRLTEREVADHIEETGMACRSISKIGRSKHLFSHIEWHMTGYLVEVESGLAPDGAFWIKKNALVSTCAVPAAFKAYFDHMSGQSV